MNGGDKQSTERENATPAAPGDDSPKNQHARPTANAARGTDVLPGNRHGAAADAAYRSITALGQFCMAMVGAEHEARSLVQQTLAAARAGSSEYRSSQTVESWLFAIARNLCARHLEHRAPAASGPETSGASTGGSPSPRDRARRARALLADLSPNEREALLLRYVAGLSYDELGEACGMDEPAARARVSEGLANQCTREQPGNEPPVDPADRLRITGNLAGVLEGTAAQELFVLVGRSRGIQSLLDRAEHSVGLVRDAGMDYVDAPEHEELFWTLLAVLAKQAPVPEEKRAPSPEPAMVESAAEPPEVAFAAQEPPTMPKSTPPPPVVSAPEEPTDHDAAPDSERTTAIYGVIGTVARAASTELAPDQSPQDAPAGTDREEAARLMTASPAPAAEQSAAPAPVEAEPSAPPTPPSEPVKPEPIKAEPSAPPTPPSEPVKPEPVKAEPSAPPMAQPEPVEAKPSAPPTPPSELVKAEPARGQRKSPTPSAPSKAADSRPEPAPKAAPSSQPPASTRGHLAYWGLGGAAVLGVIVAAVMAPRWEKPKVVAPSTPSWSGAVELVSSAGSPGLQGCGADGQHCQALSKGGPVASGSWVKTDPRTRARLKLSDGTVLTLDRATRLRLGSTRERELRLENGTLVVSLAQDNGRRARIDTPGGRLESVFAEFAVSARRDSVSVDVSRGEVEATDLLDRSVELHPGENGRLERRTAPCATSGARLDESLAWSDWGKDGHDAASAHRGLGEVSAQNPGEAQERERAVPLTSHRVKVRIEGGLAHTEVDEVFSNQAGDTLGMYRFALPADATVDRVAVGADGKLREGTFVDRELVKHLWGMAAPDGTPKRKARPGGEVVWAADSWQDPTLRAWQRGGGVEVPMDFARAASRRVIVAYSQMLSPTCGVRRYAYPLAFDTSGTARVDDFRLQVELRGHDDKFGVMSLGYDSVKSTPAPDVVGLEFAARSFVPAGDFGVEYALPERDSELTVWASPSPQDKAARRDQPAAESSYLALALRPKLPRTDPNQHRAVALAVDSSRSMFGERFRRSQAVVTRIARELDRQDRVTVLACDTTCRTLPGGLREPGPATAQDVERFLTDIVPEGASDVAGAIASAKSALGSDDALAARVVYVGDGLPTLGALRPENVRRAVEAAMPQGQGMLIALGVGADSDIDTLRAAAQGGGGVVLSYWPGESTAEAAYSVLKTGYGLALQGARVRLPEGLTDTVPARMETMMAGGESMVMARMTGSEVSGNLVVNGRLGQKPFEQQYPLRVAPAGVSRNALLPSLLAAAQIADLEQKPGPKANRRIIELSQNVGVPSRHTSLVVLGKQAWLSGFPSPRTIPEWAGPVLVDVDAEQKAARANPSGEATTPVPRVEPAAGAGKTDTNVFKNPPVFEYEAFPDTEKAVAPVRRVTKRVGEITTDRTEPLSASAEALAEAERELGRNPNRRGAVKRLYTLYALRGDLEQAKTMTNRWIESEPLDGEALRARADLAARLGDRESAIRILGGVVEMSPGDARAQLGLARLHHWAGHQSLACRHYLAIAQITTRDDELIAEAVRCARATGVGVLGDAFLEALDAAGRTRIEQLVRAPVPEDKLSGDLRLEAKWNPGSDLDLALLDQEGNRISWLGAPIRPLISATTVLSTEQEGLAVRGAKPGEYVVEIVRASGTGPVSGTVAITVADNHRTVPFKLDGARVVIGLVIVRTQVEY